MNDGERFDEEGSKRVRQEETLRLGLPFMREMVRQRNEERAPYRISLAERARSLESEEVLMELKEQAKMMADKLNKMIGNEPTREQLVEARDLVRPELLALARGARAFSVHYRRPEPFRVGAAMLVLRKVADGENPWAVMFDANTKVDKSGGASKDGKAWCAEQYLMDRIDESVAQVVTIAVAGEARTDDVSVLRGVQQITLTPCAMCRDRLVYDERLAGEVPIIPKQTEVVTQDVNNLGLQKLQQVGDLHRFHGESVEVD